ncbi:hypothetical protein MELA_00274 [Candidatus Methylomirabilis lanthanidiphila]|uniref:Uncharacterized protein n=1 Tax=Candidatus Methylomirabilis lanthanidiphila TaxID=2211376 RepID=A0A564ZFI1_9BACT|nr:hypothetical protein [Candidatus Methylomirabilis lanthanidiphila]VUZ83916.1 hypothetical protein MELA_00274 [Candidatus Methylomirabilis lanthanidiphila]
MSANVDRLYELLPAIYRIRDAEQGEPLKSLLRVIAEQVNLVEEDIARLYDNWFIETCEDWVVPYIADLVGYRPVHEAGEPGDVRSEQGRARNQILIPRREVANTLRYRRRKGTLALLELLANDVSGWPARAVEFYKLLGWTQAFNHLHLDRGRTVDVRKGSALDVIDGPFDELTHTVDTRRINSRHTRGRYNIPSVGLFVWRLKSYSVTHTPAFCVEASGPHCYTFSVLGNDTPLYARPDPEVEPTQIAGELNLPVSIRRRAFEERTVGGGHERRQAAAAYYGLLGDTLIGKSLAVWAPDWPRKGAAQPIPRESIVPADLSNWRYLPQRGKVAVDPVLGRIAFSPQELPKKGVWVSYHYGFSADIGGGEYDRPLSQKAESVVICVSSRDELSDALRPWRGLQPEDADAESSQPLQPPHAVIEIMDSGVYVVPMSISLLEGHSLQIRAANGKRPVIRLLDWQTNQPDALIVTGAEGSRFILDGVMIEGRGVQLGGNLRKVSIRHSTLVPGWELDNDCEPKCPAEPSLEIFSPNVCVTIEHSILGPIQVNPVVPTSNEEQKERDDVSEDEAARAHCHGISRDHRLDPIRLCISDSILDAIDPDSEAIGAPGCPVAHAVVTIRRSTVFGQIQVRAIELGENSIFNDRIMVARRQYGCLRFCYVTPGSRTPPRYNCQPDLVETAVAEQVRQGQLPAGEKDSTQERERLRVRPRLNSTRYGMPAYCQLAHSCAGEIKRGADDESEMGAFHDLFQPQREANLCVRLDEYVPAGADVGIILVS